MADIVGVGHSCQDYLCIVEHYPPEDGSTHITEIHTQGGGAVATALVAAARLGVSAALIGNLGDDAIGDAMIEEFNRSGVDTSAVGRQEGVQSLTSYVMIDPAHGTRTKFPRRDRMPPIAWNGQQIRMLKGAKILHLDGTHYQNACRAIELARQNNVSISLDGCSRQQDNNLNRRLASMADILIMNAAYPLTVSERPNLHDALLEMSTWGAKIVLSTAGANGVFAAIDGKIYHYPPCKVKVFDSTGAGDVFHGAYLAAYLNGKSLDHCIRFAQYAAALKCGQIGGRQGIPSRDAVEQNYLVFAGPACEI